MLIVRGVNVFPSAIREVVAAFPDASGAVLVVPRDAGVKQEPPLPVRVELARDAGPAEGLAAEIARSLRNVLVFQSEIELVPYGTLARSDYKTKLVQR